MGGAWAEPRTAGGSCDESVSCEVLPARQNLASTPAARHSQLGRGKGRRTGPRTRHADLARLPKPLLGNRERSGAISVTHTHTLHAHTRVHRRAVIWSLHLISTPKAWDESDPWKIKIDWSKANKTARKSSPKRDMEGGSCLGALKCQTQFQDSFLQEEGEVPHPHPTSQVPALGGHPKGESPSCSAQPCRFRRGNSGLGPGSPRRSLGPPS